MSKLKVLFTVDTEVWPGAWDRLDERFPEAFRRYVYGDTSQGQCALPLTLKILNDHGLRGVFLVEPLFSARFGLAPLQEIVGLIRAAGQDVQMHLHAEWADEAREQVLPVPARSKRQHLSYYSLDEQLHLVRWGQRRLIEAGSPAPTAFRAGSYRFNEDTLRALGQCGFEADTSYNHCSGGLDSRIGTYYPPACVPLNALEIHGVAEFPVTVFRDRPGHLRPMQLTACSLAEMRAVLDRAADEKRPFLNIVSHNFELLDRRDFSLDKVVFRRFLGLCDYLRKHVDRFETVSFASLLPIMPHGAHPLPTTGSWRGLGQRLFEQALRRA